MDILHTVPVLHCSYQYTCFHNVYVPTSISWLSGCHMQCHSPLWGLSATQWRQAVASKLFPSPPVTIKAVNLQNEGCYRVWIQDTSNKIASFRLAVVVEST